MKQEKSTYLTLPKELYHIQQPKTYERAKIIYINELVANNLNLSVDDESTIPSIQHQISDHPYAMAYAAHQYGHFTNLGDGRAICLGETVTSQGERFDIVLKGSGKTPYSRRGDGLATLESVLREYLMSGAMHHLGIQTSNSLCVFQTNEVVKRQQFEPGGALIRVAKSHIRFGTFEYVHAHPNLDITTFADYVIERHFPHCKNEPNPYIAMLKEIAQRSAELVSSWQSIGFSHGVLNTDNMLVSGETIDYGPCAFLDHYQPTLSFSSIDHNNRYSYQNQPYIVSWNLSKLFETCLSLLSESEDEAIEIANQILREYQQTYEQLWESKMLSKLGIVQHNTKSLEVVHKLLSFMTQYQSDFTDTFRSLTEDNVSSLSFYQDETFAEWLSSWKQVRDQNYQAIMRGVNPYFIPKNYLLQKAINDIVDHQDHTLYQQMLEWVRTPYNYQMSIPQMYLLYGNDLSRFTSYCGT